MDFSFGLSITADALSFASRLGPFHPIAPVYKLFEKDKS
jgi:hypothetical protein